MPKYWIFSFNISPSSEHPGLILLKSKKNEIIPFAAMWMDLEIIILNEIEEDKYHMVSLICGV